jgi:hypothetical protein
MTIKIYPEKLTAYDMEIKEMLFTVEAIDECCVKITINTPVGKGDIDDLLVALKQAVDMMELE